MNWISMFFECNWLTAFIVMFNEFNSVFYSVKTIIFLKLSLSTLLSIPKKKKKSKSIKSRLCSICSRLWTVNSLANKLPFLTYFLLSLIAFNSAYYQHNLCFSLSETRLVHIRALVLIRAFSSICQKCWY